MIKYFFTVFLVLSHSLVFAGCFDGLTTSNTVYSTIQGFYISRNFTGESQEQFVILDKNACNATSAGDVILASSTKSHYYLSFQSSDDALYSSLLSAQARDIAVEFRMGAPLAGSNTNTIMYIITPAGARNQ